MGEVTLLRLGGFGQVMAAVDLGGDVLRRQPGVRGVLEHRAHELVGLNDPACRQAPTTPPVPGVRWIGMDQFLRSACKRDLTNGEVAAHSGHLPAVIRVPPVGLEPTLDGF